MGIQETLWGPPDTHKVGFWKKVGVSLGTGLVLGGDRREDLVTLASSQSWTKPQESAPLSPYVCHRKNSLSPQKHHTLSSTLRDFCFMCLLESPLSLVGHTVQLGQEAAQASSGMSPGCGLAQACPLVVG